MNVVQKILNLIKTGYVSKSLGDSDEYPRTQITFNGKATDAFVLVPYGLYHNLPKDALATAFANQGQESSLMVIGSLPQNRIKDLAEGEVAVGNPLEQSYTIYKDGGNIEITGAADVIETIAGNLETTATGNIDLTSIGNTSVTATGSANITGLSTSITSTTTADMTATTSITLTAPIININGNVPSITVTGTLNALIAIFNGIIFSSHVHDMAGPGTPTGPPRNP